MGKSKRSMRERVERRRVRTIEQLRQFLKRRDVLTIRFDHTSYGRVPDIFTIDEFMKQVEEYWIEVDEGFIRGYESMAPDEEN